MSDFEVDLMRALHKHDILDDRLDQISALFDACDIEGGPDGRITFDEILRSVDNMDVFWKPPKNG